MEILTTILDQMVVLFLLILIGYVLSKLKAVPENTPTVLSKVENNLFVPVLVLGTFFTGITVANMDIKKVLSMKSIYAVSFVRLIVFPLIFIGVFKLWPLPQK